MAFIETSTNFVSFAQYTDMTETDSRLFVANEALTEDVVTDLLVRSSSRILANIRSTTWWRSYYQSQDTTGTQLVDIPEPSGLKIKARRDDFTDLCCYHTMYYYILPKVADFGSDDNDEKQKLGYYEQKYTKLFMELITAGDWYDFDGTGTITTAEKSPGTIRLKRIR